MKAAAPATASSDRKMRRLLDLALVIPVWNDPDGLRRLILQADTLEVFSEIIVVDDVSDGDLSLNGLGISPDSLSIVPYYIRLEKQSGAGCARNVGLERVSSRYAIFFDSDDLFDTEFEEIVSDLADYQGDSFDFCIFRHHDSRLSETAGRGGFEQEEAHWQRIGATPKLQLLDQAQAATLCRIAAYPWNKIYDVDFLRRQNVRCTELPVHNDVELHWSSFIAAERILCTSRVGAEHVVAEYGARLTNRTDAERLRVFEAFENVIHRLHQSPNATLMLEPFIDFCARLIRWINLNMHGEFHSKLERRVRDFFVKELDTVEFTLIAYRNPDLATTINNMITRGLR